MVIKTLVDKLQLNGQTTASLLRGLRDYYLADPFIVFKQFRTGAIAFGIGLGMILYASQGMTASINQELLTMAGIIIGGFGFIVAMLAQIRLLIGRFVRFFAKRN